jgi:hypothetical protein
MRPRPEDTIKVLDLPDVNVSWSDFYRNFKAVYDGKESRLFVTPEEEIRDMKIVDLCFESAQKGQSLECRI